MLAFHSANPAAVFSFFSFLISLKMFLVFAIHASSRFCACVDPGCEVNLEHENPTVPSPRPPPRLIYLTVPASAFHIVRPRLRIDLSPSQPPCSASTKDAFMHTRRSDSASVTWILAVSAAFQPAVNSLPGLFFYYLFSSLFFDYFSLQRRQFGPVSLYPFAIFLCCAFKRSWNFDPFTAQRRVDAGRGDIL